MIKTGSRTALAERCESACSLIEHAGPDGRRWWGCPGIDEPVAPAIRRVCSYSDHAAAGIDVPPS